MNRTEFQRLSNLRLAESKALLTDGFADGAYYLAGYAVECALKACIAKRTQEHDFPEKGSHKYYSHDLEDLVAFAQLQVELSQAVQADAIMKTDWTVVQNWSEESRYEASRTTQEATDLLSAIENQNGGVLPWLRQRW
ncbi:MAG: HEPN domain-containing protein [Terracidiphilus sp.]